MKATLVVNHQRSIARDFVHRLVDRLSDNGISVVDDAWDLVIAIGGDGTMLEATRIGLRSDSPVLGFNLGTVGFLAESEPDEMERAVADLASGRYRVETRPTLEADLKDRQTAGVNDVVIEKIDSQRLVVLDVMVDGTPFYTYRADGLVVATSTGSTAYSFSSGGPLVDPSLATILVTPVAPHSLFNRSVIVGIDTVIDIRVAAARPTRVSVDGQEVGTLDEDGMLSIRRGSRDARFIRFDKETFPARLARKFRLE